ncbi:MAG TPA: DegT/DnrJ/EryC1/StrS family aminotransferase [Solirubrobacteraceae bacterium]|nr:DegT/DnrJ/EryC1/StrS family aminotransferase [Solirubrobacteraceae bacterium]
MLVRPRHTDTSTSRARDSIPFNDLRRTAEVDEDTAAAVERVVRSGWYLLGEETSAFEREFADYLGTDHAIGLASGTDALELALAALGCATGQEVLTAANAGGYSTCAARRRGLHVRYADVDESSLLLTAETVAQALTARTTVVVVTHLYGKMADVAAICDVCHPRGIRVLEDCAQAAGARTNGSLAGSVADAGAFSFYPTKNLAALGDAGAVVTSDDDVAESVRRLRQYGWGAKYKVQQDGGRNSRVDEIQAAALRVRLRELDGRNRRRREIAARYAQALADTSAQMVHTGEQDYVAHLAVLRSPRRDELAAALRAEGIGSEIHYPVPDHRQAVIGAPSVSLPVSEAASQQVLSLPCFPELEQWELDTICFVLAESV